MALNIQEILVANGTGAVMIIFLLFIRSRNKYRASQIHEKIFNAMMACNIHGNDIYLYGIADGELLYRQPIGAFQSPIHELLSFAKSSS